jgi:hypothetical protein
MFGGFESAIVKAAWIVAAPFWCLVIGLAVLGWHLHEKNKNQRK